MSEGLSRRSFFAASTAAAAAAVVGLGVTGCSSSSASGSNKASSKSNASSGGSSKVPAAKGDPIRYDTSSQKAAAGEFVIKANGTWLKETGYMTENVQQNLHYFMPLAALCEALDIDLENSDGSYLMKYGDFSVAPMIYEKDGVPYISTEFLSTEFAPVGISASVRPDTDSTDSGSITVDLRTNRSYILAGKDGEYEMTPGEYEYKGVHFTYRKAVLSGLSSDKAVFVTYLHGGSGVGFDNSKHMTAGGANVLDYCKRHNINVVLIAPQAGQGTYSYYKYAIADMIKNEIKSNSSIDSNRVYVMGGSMGGGGTWQVVDAAPELFAGAQAVAQYAETPEDVIPLGCPNDPVSLVSMENLVKVPTMLVAGSADVAGPGTNHVAIENTYNKLKAAGGVANYALLEGLTHGQTCQQAFIVDDYLDWTFSHVK